MYPSGRCFSEYRSDASFFGLPLLHYTCGICPETGRRVVARGVIAVGRLACGVVAIGQASVGVVAIGQLAIGMVLAFGQAAFSVVAVGQLAVAISVGIGQVATGYTAIGQIALGKFVLAQKGFGHNVWCVGRTDADAVAYFRSLWGRLSSG